MNKSEEINQKQFKQLVYSLNKYKGHGNNT